MNDYVNPLRDPQDRRLPRIAGPCVLVIFGVTGDLSRKKLMPAVYDLANRGLLPPGFGLVGFARRDWADQDFAKVVHDAVKEGESMTAPLAASKVFPPMVISMVEVGEETGALPDMLTRIANTYDDEVDNAVAGLTSVIEPLMIIVLAVIVGTIVIAMFMPMIQIISSLGSQA